jgi:hypothetical protein
MRVIFLDFDGVLNSEASFRYETRLRKAGKAKGPVNETLCNVCTSNLQVILDRFPEVKIVISSTWRELFELEWLKEHLKKYRVDGDRVIDKTPSLYQPSTNPYSVAQERTPRGNEIKDWLDRHPEVTGYVILDDNSDMLPDQRQHFVQTDWLTGMTLYHVNEAIDVLHRRRYERKKED